MANYVFDKTQNYRVYNDGNALLGIATVDLPDIAYMTDTLSGAGISGEIDTPVMGHIQSMQLTLHWRSVLQASLALLSTEGGTLTLMSSQQAVDTSNSHAVAKPLKIVVRYLPHTVGLGSLEPAASTDTTTELELTYIKIWEDDKEVIEVDKLNFICNVNGKDYLADVRKNMGM